MPPERAPWPARAVYALFLALCVAGWLGVSLACFALWREMGQPDPTLRGLGPLLVVVVPLLMVTRFAVGGAALIAAVIALAHGIAVGGALVARRRASLTLGPVVLGALVSAAAAGLLLLLQWDGASEASPQIPLALLTLQLLTAWAARYGLPRGR